MSDCNYKTIKIKLDDIVNPNINYTNLFSSIKRINEIMKLGSLFIKAFIIHSIDNDLDITHISIDTIRMAFSVLCTQEKVKKKGRPFEDTTDILQKLSNFLNDEFKIYTGISGLNSTGLSYMLNNIYSSTYDEITNNILYNFDKQIWAFIKAHFPKPNKIKSKQHTITLNTIKDCLYNNTKSDSDKINYWVFYYKQFILPSTFDINKFELDINTNNFKYIKCMHYINTHLQSVAQKSYQIFPLKTKSYDNYVKINTSALIEIFYSSLPNVFPLNIIEYYKKAGDTNFQEEIWNKIFLLKNNIGNYKYKFIKHSFNYEINTDGYGVSLNFIDNDDIVKKNQKKENFRKARNESYKLKKENPDNYDKLLEEKNMKKLEKEAELKQKRREMSKQKRLEFKKLSKEEQDIIKNKMNAKEEFPYIELLIKNNKQLGDEIYNAFNNGKLLYIDPGKRSIFYIMGTKRDKLENLKFNNFGVTTKDDKKFFNYTSKTRKNCLKTDLYNKKGTSGN